jgi:GTPase SAR1 family protein
MIRAQSVYNFLNKKTEELPFTDEWYEAFANPSPTGIWLIYGNSGSGKTSFILQLAKYFDEDLNMRVAFQSMEEYGRTSLKKACRRVGWREKGSSIQMLPPSSPEELFEWLKKHYKTKVVIIDTIQYWVLKYQFTIEQFFDLKAAHSDKLFIFMSHVNGNEPDGKVAVQVMRDADLKVYVQGFRAISKGRDFGPKGYYVIWPEKERKIYLSEE